MVTDWKNLIKEIERGNCAIFLGHGLLTDSDGTTMYSKFCKQISDQYGSYIQKFYPEENFFLFKAPWHKSKITNQLEEDFKSIQPDMDLYRMLAEIPVSLYISVSPDSFLEQTMGGNSQSANYYDGYSKTTAITPTREKPLIYHIFGSTTNANSLLVSHDDLYNFFVRMLGEQSLPQPIKEFFHSEGASGEVIFLGFTFSKWYVQLLLRLFNLSKPEVALHRTAYLNGGTENDELEFASTHFQVDFIETNIAEFVRELHKQCKEKGILRQLNPAGKEVEAIITVDLEKRVSEIKEQLLRLNRLRSEYEDKATLSDDPKERMRCELELSDVRKNIDALRKELDSYRS